ncbi:MAG: L-fuculokinase [Marinifilum sp.]|jgi:L-fuculokinase|nr:L-fuculokinase [Marinifilum sp.]
MQEKDIALVFDCGATNVRVIAMDKRGSILASHSMSNETDEDPNYSGGRIWDLDKLWNKLCESSRIVTSQIDTNRIVGTTVTTFGVDGAFVDEKGELLYPVISWQCQRTAPIMNNINKYLSLEELYKISGVYPYAFNTINKMIWFKENKPEVIESSYRFLFIPSLIIHKLSGAMQNDATMMGTAMMADLGKRTFSDKIAGALGIDKRIFGDIAESGEKIGEVTCEACDLTGIPERVPTFVTGHDTQFAIFGSGAQLNQPVLSSGTWEILMSRSASFSASSKELENNLTTELDSISGVYNIGQNWLSSGVMEWFSKNFYPELNGDALYDTMIKEAELEMPGAKGVMVDPAFYDDGSSINSGTITGLTISTSRSQLYRAFLESLAFRLREGLVALETAGDFKTERIICVGGGSKNRLWNQLRADVCNVPIQLIDQKETTVLGASMFVFAGAGVYKSANVARQRISYNPQVINPSGNRQVYDQLYNKYIKLKK